MKKLFWFILPFLLASCDDYLKKSVLDPIPLKKLEKIIEKNPSFATIYENILIARENGFDKEETAKYSELTYQRILDLEEYGKNMENFEFLYSDWEKQYARYLQSLDSVLEYWKNYKEENALERFVKIELVDIKKEYSYGVYFNKFYLGFDFIPLEGEIQSVNFTFYFDEKGNNEPSDFIYNSYKSSCSIEIAFTQPITHFCEVSVFSSKIEKLDLTSFLQSYDLYIRISEVYKDGKKYSIDDLKIPESVIKYWNYENRREEGKKNFYEDNVIQKIIYPDYIDKENYYWSNYHVMVIQKDNLCYNFLELIDSFSLKN